jgi:hypothetical protein
MSIFRLVGTYTRIAHSPDYITRHRHHIGPVVIQLTGSDYQLARRAAFVVIGYFLITPYRLDVMKGAGILGILDSCSTD